MSAIRRPAAVRPGVVASALLALLAFGAVVTAAAGPPFPPPVDGQRIHDTARIFGKGALASGTATIRTIEDQTGAQVVVYTQVKPEATEESVKADGRALGNQWGVGRQGFDDGLVLIFDMDATRRHGKVAFVGGAGFTAAYVDDAGLQVILDEAMIPQLRAGNFDGALVAGLERVATATSPEAAAKLRVARQVNSLVGLVVGPLLLILLAGFAFLRWYQAGRDPIYVDSPSIYLPAPPDRLTPATGALLLDGRSSRRALTTALLDLASRDELAFFKRERRLQRDTIGIELRQPDAAEPRIRLNRRPPLGLAEGAALSALRRNATPNELGARLVEGDDLLTFGKSVAAFEQTLEQGAVDGALFAARPSTVAGRWTAIAVGEFVLAVVAVIAGASLPASGLVLLGGWLSIAAVITGLFSRHMPARTKNGAMVRAMLLAYRRTLAATLAQARSLDEVVAEPRLAWLQTPDRAVVWATALDLGDEAQQVLERTAADLEDGRATAGAAYRPTWFYSSGGGREPGGGVAPGLMSSSAVPDFGGMFAALGTIGNQPSSSGSGGGMGGGGGFSGGASGSF